MKRIFLGILLALFSVATFAQTYKQRGVVRMITSSASAPTTPVKGVNVVVENNVSGATGADGAFRVDVTKEFVVSGIAQEDYILALPTRGKTYYYSKNDLDVVVTTKAKREADYKKLYQQIREKYDAQTDEVNRLRREYKQRLTDLDAADAEYVDLQVKLDSLQALYEEIIDNEDNIDDLISDISDDLAITDYLSLDDFNRKIFDLKCAGEWKSISDLLNDVMHGDAASYLQSAIDNKVRAEAARKKAERLEAAARRDLEARFKHIEDAIEAFMMQHLNDSVSRYYEILTKAAPNNWEYLEKAGEFERSFQANFDASINYHQKALEVAHTDAEKGESNSSLGAVYGDLEDFDKALIYFSNSLEFRLNAFGEKHEIVADVFRQLGILHFFKGYQAEEQGQPDKVETEFAQSIDFFNKALPIFLEKGDRFSVKVANVYMNMGMIECEKGNLDKGLELFLNSYNSFLKAGEKYTINVAESLTCIGNAYRFQGKLDEAMEYYQKSLAKYIEAYHNEQHPNVALTYSNLGETFFGQEKFAEALDYFQKSLDIFSKFLPADNPNITEKKEYIELCKQKLNQK